MDKMTIEDWANSYLQLLAQCGWNITEEKIYEDHTSVKAALIVASLQDDGLEMD